VAHPSRNYGWVMARGPTLDERTYQEILKDLAAQGFPLIGGRLDYLGGRPVAALVFQRHKHIINLFVWPATEADSNPGALPPIQGYNLVHWTAAQMTFWAVSDLNQKELTEFATTFENP